MHNVKNEAVLAKYKSNLMQPTDLEYSTYIARELLGLGFTVRRKSLPECGDSVILIEILGGACRVPMLCKSFHSASDAVPLKSLSELLLVPAPIHIFVTNQPISVGANITLQEKKIAAIGAFKLGDDVLKILELTGFLPVAIIDELKRSYVFLGEEETVGVGADCLLDMTPDVNVAKMTPLDKYKAGLYHAKLPEALCAVAQMSAVSASGLDRKLHVGNETSKLLIKQLTELGVINKSAAGVPRTVAMTKGMIEKQFGLRLPRE